MIQVNAAGRKVKDLGIEEPRPGTDLYLTIDLDVQRAAEEGLGDRAGAVVAMDPNSGEILALASHPNYDPNLFPRGISPQDWVRLMNDPSHPLYNRAIQSVYPPGSTFKIVVSLAGLEFGVINPDEKITCHGSLKSGSHSFRCWKKDGHGPISFHQALVESCDVYFYTMGDRIGWDRVAAYARKLGYGSLTGIPMPDEKPGLIPTTEWKKKRTGETWRGGDTFINSIGQGFVLVSPIQACQMIERRRERRVFLPAHPAQTVAEPGDRGGQDIFDGPERQDLHRSQSARGSASGAGRRRCRAGRHRPRGRGRRSRPWPARPGPPRSSRKRSPAGNFPETRRTTRGSSPTRPSKTRRSPLPWSSSTAATEDLLRRP